MLVYKTVNKQQSEASIPEERNRFPSKRICLPRKTGDVINHTDSRNGCLPIPEARWESNIHHSVPTLLMEHLRYIVP